MARNSRHKSHRSHKHRDRSESEDDGNSRDRKPRAEEDEVRVSRVSDQEKTKSSTKGNGDVSGDHGKTRKGDDRWKGGGDDDSRVEKESGKEGFDVLNLEKSSKSKSSSTKRHDGSSERNEEKRRSEKESGRRENISQYTDGKEKEKVREREKDKKVEDSKRERSEDRAAKHDVEISELQDNMRKPEVEKELDRRNRHRDGYSDHDGVDDWKKGDDKQASYRDERSKNGSYKDGRYKEKYREELDRDQRHRDDKRRDERSSRTHTGERSESKHYRDENKMSDSRDKKTKLQDSDRDGSRHDDDYSTKFKDTRGRKRSSGEIEDHNDKKPRSGKEAREDTTKNTSSSSKLDSRPDRVRLEHSHTDKVASSMSISGTKNSPNNNTYAAKDQNRHSSRQPESTHREPLSGDARRSSAVSRDCLTSSGRDRMPECRSSEKARGKDNIHSDVLMSESHHDRITRSDTHTLPNQLTEKSPSTNERRPERSTARRSDVEEGGQRSSSSRGGREREYLAEKPPDENDISPLGPSSVRTAKLQGNSPGRLPPPPNRFGSNSSSVLGAYEDETRIQSGDPKTNARYKRGRDASVGRGPGAPWKGSAPTWPSPVANGFMPLQHGPPPSFHPVVPQFPAPTLFGSRPPMDLNNNSYRIHEAGNRFPGHVPRPYGWHNSVDDHPPHLQMWDGNPNIFGNEWDQNRLLMGGRGWEMGTDNIWNGQNGNVSMEFPPVPQEHEYSRQAQVHEAWVGQSGNQSRDERPRSEQPIADGSGIKPPNVSSLAKQAVGVPSKSLFEKASELSKIPSVKGISETHGDGNGCYCSTYLSKLDISPDLVQPNLYKQCMSLLDAAAGRLVTHNVPIQGWRKKNVESFRLVTKSGQFNCIYPTASDATFQRAMSLYRKQKEGMKAVTSQVTPLALPLCSEKNPPESKEGETVGKTLSGDYMEEEDKGVAAVVEGDAEKMQCESVEAEETRCDNKLSDAVVFIEGSEGSEAKILPECRENISRILLYPESTH